MKLSKIIALILALVCMVSVLASCHLLDLEGANDKAPETPKEYYEYALAYMQEHAYKQTTVSEGTILDETYSHVSVCHMDGANYYIPDEDGVTSTYYDGTLYVQTWNAKRKTEVDVYAIGESYGYNEDYFTTINDYLTDDNITLIKNDDGTTTLKFSVTLPVIGDYDYVMTLDKDYLLVEYVMINEVTLMGTTTTLTDTTTIEYGDQYKVNPPADPDSYEVVDSYYDLFK